MSRARACDPPRARCDSHRANSAKINAFFELAEAELPAAQERRWKAIIALLAERFGAGQFEAKKEELLEASRATAKFYAGYQTLGFTPDSHFDPVKIFDKDAIARIWIERARVGAEPS